jgi:hypothetical protein
MVWPLQIRQYESFDCGSRQEASSLKYKVANRLGAHERFWDDHSNPNSPKLEISQHHLWTRGKCSSQSTVSEGQSRILLEDSRNLKSSDIRTDKTIDSYKQPTRHPPKREDLPRVLTPIEPTTAAATSPSISEVPLANFLQVTSGSSIMAEAAISLPPGSPPPLPVPPVMESAPYSGNQSRSAFDKEWEYIERKRFNTFSLRSAVQQIRIRLRQKRDSKSTVDDRLFQKVRREEISGHSLNFTGDGKSEPLADLIEENQKARDEYGPLEDECGRLEDKLYREESRLYKLEGVFYSNWTVMPTPRFQNSSPVGFLDESSASASSQDDDVDSLSHSSMTQYHPLTAKFLSVLGDLDLLREQLDDIVEENEHLEEQSGSRNLVGLPLGAEEQKWLANSGKVQDGLHDQIRAAEKEIDDLRKECLIRNLVDKYDNPTEFQGREPQISDQEVEVKSGSEVSVYSKFPFLIPSPVAGKQKEAEQYEPMRDEKIDVTTFRINKWLLERLRSSPLDVILLASTFEKKGGNIHKQWQFQVVAFWYEDATIKNSAGIRPYTSSMTTQAPVQSDHSDTVGNFKINGHSYRLFLN